MKFISLLPISIVREFAEYLIKNKYNYKDILETETIFNTLFYYLEFLNYKNIYILPNNLGIVLFIIENNKEHILLCKYKTDYDNYNLYDIYKECIIYSFKYLNEPF